MPPSSDQQMLRKLTEDCLRLFSECRRIPGLSPESAAWLENHQALFRWWSFGLKVQKPGRSSLDSRIAGHDDARRIISDLLVALAAALAEYLTESQGSGFALNGGDLALSDTSSSLSFSGDSSDSEEDQLTRPPRPRFATQRFYVESCLRHLTQISVLIRKSGERLRHQRADRALNKLEQDTPRSYLDFRNHLETIICLSPKEQSLLARLDVGADRNEYPRTVRTVVRAWLCSRLGPIQQRLIQANVIRRHRMVFSKSSGKPVASGTTEGTEHKPLNQRVANARLAMAETPMRAQEVTTPVAPGLTPSVAPTRLLRPSEAQTATAIGPNLDLGAAQRSRAASSAMSKLTKIGEKQDYPSRFVLEKSPVCPYCGAVLGKEYLKSEEKWRGHIGHDLAPYTCIFDDCKSPYNLYVKQEQWTEHLRTSHSVIHWFCSHCSFDPAQEAAVSFITEIDCTNHMVEHHSSLFAPEDLPILVELSERSIIPPTSCPLCLHDHNLYDVEDDDHIANHLHSFSVLAFPWDYDIDDSAVSGDSSDPPQAPGLLPYVDGPDGGSDSELELDPFALETAINSIINTIAHCSQGLVGSLSRKVPEDTKIQNLLVEAKFWVQASKPTTAQKEMFVSLLLRIQNDLEALLQVEESNTASLRPVALFDGIAADIDTLEECLRPTIGGDDDLWQAALRDFPEEDEMTSAIEAIVDSDEINSQSLPKQLDNMLRASWRIQQLCDDTAQCGLAESIVESLQQIGDDESIFLSAPRTNLPWAIILSIIKATLSLLTSPPDVPLESPGATRMLWLLDTILKIINRGRTYGLAYTLENTPEEVVSELRNVSAKLYRTLLELMIQLTPPTTKSMRNEISRAMESTRNARGLLGRLFFLANELEDAASLCDEKKTREVDSHIKHLLENMPLVRERGEKYGESDEEMDEFDDEILARLNWLSSLPHEEHHKKLKSTRVSGTCEWLVRRRDFMTWRDDAHGCVFWLRGSFGTGKTFLSSMAVDHLMTTAETSKPRGLAFLYISELEAADRQNPVRLIRSFLRQLCSGKTGSEKEVSRLFRHLDEVDFSNSEPTLELWQELLLEATAVWPETTFILDGMDELEPGIMDFLWETLRLLYEQPNRSCKIFISSRYHPHIRQFVRSVPVKHEAGLEHWKDGNEIRESNRPFPHTYFDIEKVIQHEWFGIRPEILDSIVQGSEGSFTWAVSIARQLQTQGENVTTQPGTEPQLPLPADLQAIYKEAADWIGTLPNDHQVLASRALKLIHCAYKPLTSEELLSAIRIGFDGAKALVTDLVDEELVRDLWPAVLLLDTEQGVNVWRLSHTSLAIYFLSVTETDAFSENAHIYATKLCLTLLLEASQEETSSDPEQLGTVTDVLNPNHALQAYARYYWVSHTQILEREAESAATGDPDPTVVQMLKTFLGSPEESSPQYQAWYQRVARDARFGWPKGSILDQTVLDFIAPESETLFAMVRFSFFKLLEDWWKDPDRDPFRHREDKRVLLEVVADGKPESIAACKKLVNLGADVNQGQSNKYGNALTGAAAMGNLDWIRFLLSHGAAINPRRYPESTEFGSPLAAAAYHGHSETVELLLSEGAEVNMRLFEGRFISSLAAAASGGDAECLRVLLENGADVTLQASAIDSSGRRVLRLRGSALSEAASTGSLECLQLLIEAGADVNQVLHSGNYGSALGAAAREGHLSCLEALIEAGADVNLPLGEFRSFSGSALADAASGGKLECILALVRAGADVNYLPSGQTAKFGSPLEAAAANGSEDCVRALVRSGARVNQVFMPRLYGSTALATAAFRGHAHCLRALIDLGADVQQPQYPSEPERFGSALAAAACGSRVLCLELLIAAGADVNTPLASGEFGSALAAAAAQNSLECVRLLVKLGALVNQTLRVGYYGSALAAAAARGRKTSVQFLLDEGAHPNLQPEPESKTIFGSPLAAAALMGEVEHIRLLVAAGADPTLVLEHGPFKTALHAATEGPPTEGGDWKIPEYKNFFLRLQRRARRRQAEQLLQSLGGSGIGTS